MYNGLSVSPHFLYLTKAGVSSKIVAFTSSPFFKVMISQRESFVRLKSSKGFLSKNGVLLLIEAVNSSSEFVFKDKVVVFETSFSFSFSFFKVLVVFF